MHWTNQTNQESGEATGCQAGWETGLCKHGTAGALVRTAHVPFHWYDAVLPPLTNRSAGLSLQNVTVRPLPEC